MDDDSPNNEFHPREILKGIQINTENSTLSVCIPSDTKNKVRNVFSTIFTNIDKESCKASQIIYKGNVFTSLVNEKKFAPVEDEDLKECLNSLAYLCLADHVKYLAMPRICCGRNKKDWNTVKTMILDAFSNAYTKASEFANTNEELPEEIYIDFCYQ